MPAGRTILLIEDERDIATTLLKVLEGAGYAVQWAQNGLEGRRLAESLSPDLVIFGIIMSVMTKSGESDSASRRPSSPF